jgi:hypothetical protein
VQAKAIFDHQYFMERKLSSQNYIQTSPIGHQTKRTMSHQVNVDKAEKKGEGPIWKRVDVVQENLDDTINEEPLFKQNDLVKVVSRICPED